MIDDTLIVPALKLDQLALIGIARKKSQRCDQLLQRYALGTIDTACLQARKTAWETLGALVSASMDEADATTDTVMLDLARHCVALVGGLRGQIAALDAASASALIAKRQAACDVHIVMLKTLTTMRPGDLALAELAGQVA